MTENTTTTPKLTSKVLAKLLDALLDADGLFAQGKYDDAGDALLLRSEGGHRQSFNVWIEDFRQEVREAETPTLDIRAIVLEKVTEASVGKTYGPHGYEPSSLRAAERDKRWKIEEVEKVVNQLVEEGTLLFRQKQLWTPDGWEKYKSLRARMRERRPGAAVMPKVKIGF